MTFHSTPVFDQMIFDEITSLPVDQQIDRLKLIGVPHDRREDYMRAIAGGEVKAIEVKEPQLALTGSMPIITDVDITPTMAIEGAPGQDRPQPQVGQRTPKVVASKRLS